MSRYALVQTVEWCTGGDSRTALIFIDWLIHMDSVHSQPYIKLAVGAIHMLAVWLRVCFSSIQNTMKFTPNMVPGGSVVTINCFNVILSVEETKLYCESDNYDWMYNFLCYYRPQWWITLMAKMAIALTHENSWTTKRLTQKLHARKYACHRPCLRSDVACERGRSEIRLTIPVIG